MICGIGLAVAAEKGGFFMQKNNSKIKRMALNGMLAAMYIGLSLLSITMGPYKITIEGLPVVISAIAFGPLSAAVVGFLGEFLSQILSFGLTPTTLLWVLPAVARGLVIGLCLKPLRRRYTLEQIFKTKRVILLFIFGGLASATTSTLSTFAWYVDSKLFGYYNYALIIGAFGTRVVIGVITSVALTLVAMPVALALKKAKLIAVYLVPQNTKLELKEETDK